jgi:hypothetical protein
MSSMFRSYCPLMRLWTQYPNGTLNAGMLPRMRTQSAMPVMPQGVLLSMPFGGVRQYGFPPGNMHLSWIRVYAVVAAAVMIAVR